MATTSETIYTHTCDLCGQVRDQDELRKLYGKTQSRGVGVAERQPEIDICADCASKPVSDVLAFLDADAEQQRQPRTVTVRRISA